MNAKKLPSLILLREYFSYDEKTGVLSWKKKSAYCSNVGSEVGTLFENTGYRIVKFRYRMLSVHRIIWFLITGQDPVDYEIDHINNIRDDNRFCNLRLSTRNNNQHNRLINKKTKSGVKGVGWYSRYNCWRARIMLNKVQYLVGYFKSVEEAEYALKNYRNTLHGEFTNHGT